MGRLRGLGENGGYISSKKPLPQRYVQEKYRGETAQKKKVLQKKKNISTVMMTASLKLGYRVFLQYYPSVCDVQMSTVCIQPVCWS